MFKSLYFKISLVVLTSFFIISIKDIFLESNIFINLIIMFVLFFINLVYIKFSLKPLKKISDKLNELSNGTTDLTVKFSENSSLETIELSRGLNNFIKQLEQLIAKISNTSEKLADSSINLSSNLNNLIDSKGKKNDIKSLKKSMDNILENVTSQTAYSEEVSSSTTEISSSINSVANMAEKVNEIMQNTVKSAKKGELALKENLDKFKIIENTVGDIENRTNELGTSSKKVYEIVDLINRITDQTNLLALNAAIEAARAGEAGKGFAVVADEVRKLATDSNNATKEIESLVSTILSEVNNVIQVTQNGSREIKEGIALTEATNTTILEVIKNVNSTSSKVEEISSAMIDQKDAIEEITNATSESAHKNIEINDATIEQSNSTRIMEDLIKKSVTYSSTVSEVASALKNITSNFKINPDVKIESNKIVEWNKTYSVLVEAFDKEHIRLFDLINELNDTMLKGRSKDNIIKVIDALAEYTVEHFANEEEPLKETNYSEYKEHKQAHEKFVNKVIEFRNKVESGEAMLSIEIIEFLKDWLLNHIGVYDKKYSKHLNKNGIK